MSKTLCIYHGSCQDGFGAAWAVRHALGAENVEFYPGVYQSPPPDVTGRDVVMVDFSYKRPVIEEMAKTARSITIFDHHASAADDLAGYPLPGFNYPPFGHVAKVTAIFDMERSGAGLAWDCFHPGQPRPRLINVIEDRDLWRFALEGTREISAAVFSYGYDFDLWDALMDSRSLDELLLEGEAIERKHQQDIVNLLPMMQRRMTIGGVDMPVANLPLTLTSDAGHKMASAETCSVAACYWDTPEGRVFSLRSTEYGPDCKDIAVKYGGGGHPHAAGFRMPLGWEGDS
jgi:nanoRNase/pAp phosphatase (c-di-AMP/oligoRNAs hydrolase)